ncbi:hypothetical protein [Streptomyces sp. NPDC088727]|uniref:hypothetical protein n=1 Tax=Streptomyces sp. NPDC088727 TaxID=3365875 RepID=UPI0038201386
MVDVTKGPTDPADLSDPFGGNSQRFSWNRAVMLGQLQAEMGETIGPDVRVALVFPRGENGQEVTPDAKNPIVVYVTPSSVDLAAVRKLMSAHRPDPYYGMDSAQRQDAQLREKIASGQDLTLDDMQRALRLLVN